MTETATSPDTLPQYKGLPVPWIARWSNEHSRTPAKVERKGNQLAIYYEDGNEIREASGLLWIREGITRSGEPQWAQVNTYRQRASMVKTKCQVCGAKIDERPIRWLVPDALLERDPMGELITTSGPTCSPCIPLALELCPYMKKAPYTILKVLDYGIWGVQGDFIVLDRETNGIKQGKGKKVPYATPELFRNVVARQQVAMLTKYVVEEGNGA